MKYRYHYHDALKSSAAPSSSGALAAMHLVQALRTVRLPDPIPDEHREFLDATIASYRQNVTPNAYSGFRMDLFKAMRIKNKADLRSVDDLDVELIDIIESMANVNGSLSVTEGKKRLHCPSIYDENGRLIFAEAQKEIERLKESRDDLLNNANRGSKRVSQQASKRRAITKKANKENIETSRLQPVSKTSSRKLQVSKSSNAPLALRNATVN